MALDRVKTELCANAECSNRQCSTDVRGFSNNNNGMDCASGGMRMRKA